MLTLNEFVPFHNVILLTVARKVNWLRQAQIHVCDHNEMQGPKYIYTEVRNLGIRNLIAQSLPPPPKKKMISFGGLADSVDEELGV